MTFHTKSQKSRGKKQPRANHQTNAGSRQLSLGGFQPVMWPTVFPAKLVYSDYRTLTCSVSQAEYVYRINSVFDPDQTGVGGQPDGFDQLKALYGRYRVVACDCEVECIGQSANGLLAIAPTDTPGGFLSAEEVAGLRYARSATFSSTEKAVVRARYHIGKLLGYSDETLLGSANCDAPITANPAFQQYLVVGVEGGSSATQVQNVRVKLTYYVRMEVPIATLDSAAIRRARIASRSVESASSSCTVGTEGVPVGQPGAIEEVPPPRAMQLASAQLAPSSCHCCSARNGPDSPAKDASRQMH